MLEVNTIVNECYILRRQVGEDCFTEWWQASAIFVASNFLLRFIKPEYASDVDLTKSFFESVKQRITMVSPAILGLIEIDRFGDIFFIASEYDGHTHLKSILDSGRLFSVEHSCRLVIELAEGVGAFHQRGDAFGVLAPECVAVHAIGDRIDEIKILLPGYELFYGLVPETRPDDYKETWGYASPELKRGKPTDARSDIYSLGVILFRLLAGKLPYGSRSGIRVWEKSASPAHVAAALARRGVPRELTTTTVRSLRKNPALRHNDIMAFIAELRYILDARRETWMKAGEPDPIADLATLNLKKAKADVREIVRSLETVNYFRHLSQGGDFVAFEQIETLVADAELLELEEAEADGNDDNDGVATADYVDAGYEAAKARRLVVAPLQGKETTAGSKAPAAALPAQLAMPGVRSAQSAIPQLPPVTPPGQQPLSAGKTRRTRGAAINPLVWRQTGGTPEDVAISILEAVDAAESGVGIVKFIEEPATGHAAATVAAALDSMRDRTVLVEVGELPYRATIAQVVEALERTSGLTVPAGASTKRPAAGLAARTAKALCAIINPETPLVFVAHGAGTISRSAHRLFLELAKQALGTPLCAFLFYSPGEMPSWHVLAALDKTGLSSPRADRRN